MRLFFVRGVILASNHLFPEKYEETLKGEEANLTMHDLYGFDLDKIDPGAMCQNMMCEIEKMMGIFPNINQLTSQSTLGGKEIYEK